MKKPLIKILARVLMLLPIMLSGCVKNTIAQTVAPTISPEVVEETAVTAPPTTPPVEADLYEPVDASICQMLQEAASQALNLTVNMDSQAAFLDPIANEAGIGCSLSATGSKKDYENMQQVMSTLMNSVGTGWNELTAYQADGPSGTATGLARDMALMLITVDWQPDPSECSNDPQASNCAIPVADPFKVDINIAQYKATFSLDGHWEDPSANFTLDLYQEWKHIYGHHTTVAQNGNKIDSLEVSIDGMLADKVVDVQFQSSFTQDVGKAQITYLDVNTIQWKIIDPPDGEYYLPMEATLTR